MKVLNYFAVAILVLSFFTACEKNNEPISTGEYLIFGHYYGFCGGENCVVNFKLTDQQLFKDQTSFNYAGSNPFDFVELDSELYKDVNDLLAAVPEQLESEPARTFGCPDCADGGGMLIEYRKDENSEPIRWLLDMGKGDVPAYLHDFMNQVNEKIELLIN